MGRPKLPRDENGNIIREKIVLNAPPVSPETFVAEPKIVEPPQPEIIPDKNLEGSGDKSFTITSENIDKTIAGIKNLLSPFHISISFHQGQTLTGTGRTALEALQSIPRPDKIIGKAIFKISQGDKKKEMLFMPAKMKRIFYTNAQPILIKWLQLGLK